MLDYVMLEGFPIGIPIDEYIWVNGHFKPDPEKYILVRSHGAFTEYKCIGYPCQPRGLEL